MQETRQFGFYETILQTLHDQFHGTSIIVATVRVKGAIIPSEFTHALQWIQQRQPLLRATVKDETDFFSFVVDEKPKYFPLSFIDRKSDMRWESVVESELTHLFPLDGYQWRMLVLVSNTPQNPIHEIILTCHHSISDGISIANLFHELFSNLSKEEFIFSKPFDLHSPVEALIKKHQTPIKETLKKPSPLTTLSHDKTAPIKKRKVKNIYKYLEEKDLLKLKTQCKQAKVTINAILNAAMLLAAQEMARSTIDTTLHTPINRRPLCTPAVPKEYFGLFASMVTTFHHVEQTSSLWDLARDYNYQLNNEILLLGKVAAPGKVLSDDWSKKGVQNAVSERQSPSQTVYPNGFVVTNIGHLTYPKNYGHLNWDSLFFSSCRKAGDFVIVLHANTLHNRLMCCFTYTEPLLAKDKATRFSETVINFLKI